MLIEVILIKNFANITLCSPTGFAYMPLEDAFYSLKLHMANAFIWDIDIMGEKL